MYKIRLVIAILAILLSSLSSIVIAENLPDTPTQIAVKPSAIDQLNAITIDLTTRLKELTVKRKQLNKKGNDAEQVVIQEEIKTLVESIEEQRQSFEQIVTGGQEFNKLINKPDTPFDWQKDLLEILEPIMAELRAMTTNLRKSEILKNKITLHSERIKLIHQALENINGFPVTGLTKEASQQIEAIKKVWHARLKDSTHRKDVAQLQLDEMTRREAVQKNSLMDNLSSVALGRVTTVLIALGVALVVYGLLSSLLLLARLFPTSNLHGKMLTYQRLMVILFRLFVLLLSLFSAYYVFVIRGDQVLQGLTILLLIVALLILKNSVPRFVEELKLILNIGSVREGERLIYLGLPWKVERLGVDAILHNPAMAIESIVVPIRLLLKLESRLFHPDEPWFPCLMGDWVILGDGTFGQVKMINPDGVVLNSGGSSLFVNTSQFLSSKPKRLSDGFGQVITFGIDYRHQAIATTTVPSRFQQGIALRLQQDPTLAPY